MVVEYFSEKGKELFEYYSIRYRTEAFNHD